ncbi:MAG: hypothetical protein WAN47_08100 [Nitrosotalea sp.]
MALPPKCIKHRIDMIETHKGAFDPNAFDSNAFDTGYQCPKCMEESKK